MRKLYFLFFLFLVVHVQVVAQAVTTKPYFPSADQEVTLIFDVTQAKDARAKGLLGKTTDVYLWSGAGSTATGDAFQYQPAGQTDFSKPFNPGKMTYLGNNRWQIKLVPRQYYGVPAGTPIRKLGVLLKSGDGKAQTEDFFVTIYDGSMNVALRTPAEKDFYVDANTLIPVKAYVSKNSDITLKVDGAVVTTVQDKDSITYQLNAGNQAGVRKTVVLEAVAGSESASATFNYTVKPQPAVAALPAGIKDGINYTGGSSAVLSLFAPEKSFVYVIGEFNNWQPSPQYLMKRTPDGTRYWLELTNLPAGQEVAFQYLVDGTIAVADPYAEKILDPNNDKYLTAANYPNLKPYPQGANGIVSVLQTNQTPYNWKVKNFERPDPKNMVVYELLVRDFVATQNYKTLADTLTYLKKLGVNAIELMPIMEFSGNNSWGYNPIFYFAPDKAYGTENDLKAFIDKCHENGMAVILDMVLNQADYEFPYVKMYWDGSKPAANNPYFNQQATHPYSVFFDFNHESAATKAFVERVNRYWLEEYKFDGFRFDLSKGFTQKNTGNDVGAWSAYDATRVATWKRIYDEIRSYDPTAYVMLEHLSENREEKELADYGMLFWGNLNYDYRNAAKGNASNFEWISYKQRTWQQPYVVGYMESHDEERLIYDVVKNGRSEGTYNTRNLTTALNRAKLDAAFFFPVPGPKLIWQFGELGYDVSIDYIGRTDPKPIRWEYQQNTERQKLYKVYAELIKLKQTYPVFKTTDFNLQSSTTVKRLIMKDETMDVFIIGNFDVKIQSPEAGFPMAGKWIDYFTGEEVNVTNPLEQIVLQPGEFRLYTSVKLPTPESGLVPWQGVVLAAEDELPESHTVQVYPNPVEHTTVVELSDDYRGEVELQLSDLSGRVLRTTKTVKHQQRLQYPLELRQVKAGTYLLQVKKGEQRVTKKLLKLN
ncbi:alpha-amylase family glycosyl hydrolase [Pontibacter ruber]|uniref:Alpha-amylase family glycosyl hydrolase n=1 Tax=Pontibacter ruber TaxID=1343895 RepID=A0ABW5CSM3_9BACT|nr:alpha-amylase family glycosyl hydrolase [Pontibacter ruber]